MVHTATLVHDDVLDEAESRRHVPTVNHRWNNHTSILLGDYLFAQSFRLAATLPSTEACRMIGEAARRVCEGELRQILLRDALGLDEETYLSMLGGKTGELCRVACQLGVQAAGGKQEVVDALGTYGNAVGIAFQIADDFLDLWGNDGTVGKTLGTDIGQGKMTLPLIRLLQSSSPRVRREVIAILEGPAEERLGRIRPLLNDSDAQAYTLAVAQRFQRQAFASLDVLVPSEARDSLAAIGRFAIDRRF
jgi:octaprenyl-diphosphate synthase